MLAKIKQWWLQYSKQPKNSSKLSLSIGVSLLYIVGFTIFYPHQGTTFTAFTVLPIAVIAWFYGLRVGVVIGLLSFGLNTLLLNLVGHIGIGVIIETGGSSNFISQLLIAIGIGKLSDLYTKQKQAHAMLIRQHNLLTTTVDNIPISMFMKDKESRFTYANAATRKTLRVTRHEDYLGKTDFNFLSHRPQVAQQHFDIEQAIMRTGQPSLDQEFAGLDPDGKPNWTMSSKMPYYDLDGEIIGIVGINRDITERKEMNEALQQSEASLLMALEEAEMRTWHWDLVINQITIKGVSLPGFTKSNYEISYPKFLQGVYEEDRIVLQQAFHNVIADGVLYDVEYRIISSEGKIHWITSKGDVEKDENGKPISINGVSFDITAQKHAQDQRLQLTLERERMQLLTSFITQASHEFRTPLSIIATSTYILQNTKKSDNQQKYFRQIDEQIKNITQLIENLSTLSKLDSGETILLEVIDFNQMLRDMYRAREQLLHENDIRGTLNLSESRIFLQGNIEYLDQALSHVWNNALRNTPRKGHIQIRSELADNTVIVEIVDSGAGISSEDLPHIFTRFYRADKAGTTRGFGLGLAIAKAIVERFDGRIDVTSVPDQGSKFRITLPLAESATAIT